MKGLDVLAQLSDSQIRDLKQLLHGPMADSFSLGYLERAFGKAYGTVLFHELVALDGKGWGRDQLIGALDLLLLDRGNKRDWFSWVVTGSVASDLPSRDTGVIFRSMVDSAKKEILLVSFALYHGKELLGPLHRKMIDRPGFRARMILDVGRERGDTSLPAEIVARFMDDFAKRDWPGAPWPELYFDPRALEADPKRKAVVHAKCVIADDHTAFVTSANLTEAAQEKNIEVGVLIDEAVKVRQLKGYFEGLIDNSFSRIEF